MLQQGDAKAYGWEAIVAAAGLLHGIAFVSGEVGRQVDATHLSETSLPVAHV